MQTSAYTKIKIVLADETHIAVGEEDLPVAAEVEA